jgi:N-acetylglucosamine-6-phosphate deacetylase
MAVLIKNGKIITPDAVLEGRVLAYEGERISGIYPADTVPAPGNGDEWLDAGGMYVSPGFIDIHVHGGGGIEVCGATPEQIAAMCSAHAQYGTTSILPTTVTMGLQKLQEAVFAIRDAVPLCTDCNILGAHLEGPYLSRAQAGAQNPEDLITPWPEEYTPLLESWDGIRIVGVAPEVKGALELGRYLNEHGIVATIAHSDATFEQVEKAIENGFSDVTHLYSGCSGVKRVNAYRVAGVIEAGLCLDELTVQVIADGKHLPAALLRLIYKCKGAAQISLITDGLCASATTLEEGTVVRQANGMDMVYDDGVFKMMDRQAFAGSAATMNRLVRNMIELAGVPLTEAVVMASATPARIVGAEKEKGTLEPGKDADIIFFNDAIDVSRVIVKGRVIK